MKHVLIVAAVTGLLAVPAFAQNQPAVPREQAPMPAVRDASENTSLKPIAGANSFTEAQAKAAIEKRGYTQVAGLVKDAQGVWRGKAQRDGREVAVSLDYQGNVN
jgi:hypothetical protein